jgi:hypothetical protein
MTDVADLRTLMAGEEVECLAQWIVCWAKSRRAKIRKHTSWGGGLQSLVRKDDEASPLHLHHNAAVQQDQSVRQAGFVVCVVAQRRIVMHAALQSHMGETAKIWGLRASTGSRSDRDV